jgi:hypothetical protein
MLTNHDLLPFKEKQKSLSEFEILLLNQDEDYKLNLERPLIIYYILVMLKKNYYFI